MLVVDSLKQSWHQLQPELKLSEVIYVSFETVNIPSFASDFIDAIDKTPAEIKKQVDEIVSNRAGNAKNVILIDSLNYLKLDQLSPFITSLILPSTVVLGVFHHDMDIKPAHYPSQLTLLLYMASSILELESLNVEEQWDDDIAKLKCIKYNDRKYKLTITTRRKSGRALTHEYIIENGNYQLFKEEQKVEDDVLEDLTTFNLTTNLKQRAARDQVDLPYLEAQTELGSFSGAIVYEFEKDDDYDEEDPYEDPF